LFRLFAAFIAPASSIAAALSSDHEVTELDVLDPRRLASARAAQPTRARLSRCLIALLLVLRICLLLATPLDSYAFVHTVMAPPS
jgi:hypothetical protein